MAAPAVAAAARDYVIDLPQKTDAAAIARCFLEVYGHHYVHAEVFSTRRYWDKVELTARPTAASVAFRRSPVADVPVR